jgi:lipoprotein-anchoring transpeptidase ErfK/SrfK
MIEREQLAQALSGLQPRDREVLDYSLRRRVPDEDLGTLFGVDPSEVARMRATAVESLSNELGVQRGEDLGHMLKLLLDASTWDQLAGAPAPEGGDEHQAPLEPEPEVSEPDDAEPPESGHPPVGAQGHEAPASPAEPAPPVPPHEPVLGMLAGRPEGDAEEDGARGGGRRLVAGLAVALAVLAPAGMVAALTGDGSSEPSTQSSGTSAAPRTFKPQREAVSDPFPTDPRTANRYPTARVRRAVKLLDAPGGRLKVRISRKTEFGSARVLSIVQRRGEWLGVLVPELDNGQVAWIHQDKVSEFGTIPWSIHVNLSRRRLVIRKDGEKARSVRIGIGRADHPTPKGRFAVTDKLRVNQPGSPYGCCVLALTGHQTKLPPGWPGGDRLAVHATADLSGLGKQVSLGCMRTDPRDTRWMLKRIPLGTPVFIRG